MGLVVEEVWTSRWHLKHTTNRTMYYLKKNTMQQFLLRQQKYSATKIGIFFCNMSQQGDFSRHTDSFLSIRRMESTGGGDLRRIGGPEHHGTRCVNKPQNATSKARNNVLDYVANGMVLKKPSSLLSSPCNLCRGRAVLCSWLDV